MAKQSRYKNKIDKKHFCIFVRFIKPMYGSSFGPSEVLFYFTWKYQAT